MPKGVVKLLKSLLEKKCGVWKNSLFLYFLRIMLLQLPYLAGIYCSLLCKLLRVREGDKIICQRLLRMFVVSLIIGPKTDF